MKNYFLLFSFFGFSAICFAQSSAETLSQKIAQKMKDSLSLTSGQKNQLYSINMDLHNQKMAARQQYAGSDSLRIKIQRVENKRDSLYHTILTDNQYSIYLDKKRTLVNNN